MTIESELPASGMGKKVARGLGLSTVGNLGMRIGNFLVSLVMARLIAPEEFGVFAVALTVWSVLGTLAELGLGTDLIRAKDLQRRIPTVTTVGLLASSAIALLMLVAAGPLAQAFNTPDAAGVIRLMSLAVLVFGFSITPAALLAREFRQGAIVLANLAGMAASALTIITLASHDQGAASLAWGQVANQTVIVIGFYLLTKAPIRLGFDRRIAAESARFCLPLAGANLVSWVLITAGNLIVARTMSPEMLGYYSLAFNVSSWPMGAVGASLRVVALPAFSQTADRSRARAMAATGGPVWAVALAMGVGLGVLAGPTIGFLYGPIWAPAATALAGLAAFGAVRIVFDMMATFLIAVGESTWVLLVQVWWLAVMVPVMWWSVNEFGLAGAGWSQVAVAVVAVLPVYLVCLHKVGVDVWSYLRACLVPTVAAVPAAVVCWFIADRLDRPLIALLAGGAGLLLLYVAPVAPWWRRKTRALGALAPVAPQPMEQVN